jgi:2-polyprenyl-3-methyl-5-hydroxy-6-metoxy-1,4-benzoquinol methylase
MESKPAADEVCRSFYDGTTLHLRIYDSIHHSDRPVLRGDLAFYRDLAQRVNGKVLEIGVGTGRVAVELATAAIRVTGLDLSEAMLAIASEKAAASGVGDRLRLECGDMRNFALSR